MSHTTPPPNPLPSVRRIVTGHNNKGQAIILRDETLAPLAGGTVHGIYRDDGFPATIDDEIKHGEWKDTVGVIEKLTADGGIVSRVYDMPPGGSVPFHRTVSLDIGLILKGSIVLELDGGESVTLKEGDTVVQRGTNHTWKNVSDEWVRVHFVVVGARPVEVNGTTLPEILPFGQTPDTTAK